MRTIFQAVAGFGLALTVTAAAAGFDGDKLDAILAAQPDEAKARYEFRNPKETLEFFGLAPDMAVAETLPGGGWYTKILLPYVAEKGQYYGVNYSADMASNFNGITEERLDRFRKFPETFPARAAEWVDGDAKIGAWSMGGAPEKLRGKLDAVLFIRSMHNLNRFEDGKYLEEALADAFKVLKPGGMVGVVQHRAPEDNSDDWANGSNGYLKQSNVIAKVEAAGFELVETSEINANPKDKPTEEDFVWRLLPTLGGSDEAVKEKNRAIGESDRMTLKFRKPE